jgi:hypothetical protein
MVPLGLCGSIVVAAAVIAGAADTAIETRAIEVQFDGPQGCSSAEAFWIGLRARTARVRRPAAEEPRAVVQVRLSRTPSKVVGELRIINDHGETDNRKVQGATCDEVVQALSLTAALAFDPNALLSVPQPSFEAAAAEDAQPPDAGSQTVVVPPVKQEPAPALIPATEAPTREARAVPDVEMGAGLVGLTVLSGSFSPGIAVSVRKNLGRNPSFRPTLGLGLEYLRNDAVQSPRDAQAALAVVAASACPLRWSPSVFTVQPCALVLGGWLSASGIGLNHVNSASRAWLSAGLTIRAAALLGRGFSIGVEGGIDLPVLKRRFYASAPDNVVTETPSASPIVGLELIYAQ